MRNARPKILGRLFGKHVVVQSRHGGVDLLDNTAKIANQRTAFAGEIVDTGLTRAIEIGVWLQEFCRHTGWHGDTDKAIAKQTGTANGEFASLWNFHVIINLQGDGDAVSFADQTRPARNFPDARAREQTVRSFQQAAGVAKADRKRIVSFETFPQPAELHHQRAQHCQPGKNKDANLKFQTSLVPVHFAFNSPPRTLSGSTVRPTDQAENPGEVDPVTAAIVPAFLGSKSFLRADRRCDQRHETRFSCRGSRRCWSRRDAAVIGG